MRNQVDRKTKQKKDCDIKKDKKFDEAYIEEMINRLYKEAFSKPEIIKELQQEYLKSKTKEKFSSKSSNKIILKRFLKQYKLVIFEIQNKANSEVVTKSVDFSKSIDNTLLITGTNNNSTNITSINLNNLINHSDSLSESSNNVTSGVCNPQLLGTKKETLNFKLNFTQLSKKVLI